MVRDRWEVHPLLQLQVFSLVLCPHAYLGNHPRCLRFFIVLNVAVAQDGHQARHHASDVLSAASSMAALVLLDKGDLPRE
jgi:hypothetical protein